MPFEMPAHHAVDFWLCGEDLPLPESRVPLDKDDAIHLALDEKNDIAGLKRLQHKLQGMLGTWACTSTICCRTASICTKACPSGHRAPGRHHPVR